MFTFSVELRLKQAKYALPQTQEHYQGPLANPAGNKQKGNGDGSSLHLLAGIQFLVDH